MENIKQRALQIQNAQGLREIKAESIGKILYDIADKAVSDLITETTYAALKELRDNGRLKPGMFYRITDYVTTTTQDDTQSAGHQFDIIVRADSASVLNENAFAAKHAGDTYFVNCRLSAWQLKYTIDNDSEKYYWADSDNGKGVIFYMKDEHDNECPYDFKNMMFKRSSYTEPDNDITFTNCFFYTFSAFDYENANGEQEDIEDATLHNGDQPRDDDTNQCYGNSMGLFHQECSGTNGYYRLNGNVFINYYCSDTYFYCYGNTFGVNCNDNTFGNNCYSNQFGNYFQNNTFGNNCGSNNFGNYCGANTFGNECYRNTFGNECRYNQFGNECNSNSFGNNCGSNNFGNNCYSNQFGNGCWNNTFGNYCTYNTFGNGVQYITMGDYFRYITIDSGCQYVTINCSAAGSGSAYCQNVMIYSGIVGTSSSRKTVTISNRNGSLVEVRPANYDTIEL